MDSHSVLGMPVSLVSAHLREEGLIGYPLSPVGTWPGVDQKPVKVDSPVLMQQIHLLWATRDIEQSSCGGLHSLGFLL